MYTEFLSFLLFAFRSVRWSWLAARTKQLLLWEPSLTTSGFRTSPSLRYEFNFFLPLTNSVVRFRFIIFNRSVLWGSLMVPAAGSWRQVVRWWLLTNWLWPLPKAMAQCCCQVNEPVFIWLIIDLDQMLLLTISTFFLCTKTLSVVKSWKKSKQIRTFNHLLWCLVIVGSALSLNYGFILQDPVRAERSTGTLEKLLELLTAIPSMFVSTV